MALPIPTRKANPSTHRDEIKAVVEASQGERDQIDHLMAELNREKAAAQIDDLVEQLRERETELVGASALDRALGKIELQTARDDLAAEVNRRRQRLDLVSEAYGAELRQAHDHVRRVIVGAISEQTVPMWADAFQHLDAAMRQLDELVALEQEANTASGGFVSGPISPALRALAELAPAWAVARDRAHPGEHPPRLGGFTLQQWREEATR